jgi:NADH dehydrogenase
VDDLAIAVERSLTDADRVGSIYEIGGPDWVSYREIVDAVIAATGMRRLKLGMPIPLLSGLTAVTDRILPIFPVSHDQIASMSRPNFTELDAFERTFGVSPRPMDLSYLA